MPILQDEIWRKTQKLLAAGRMRSTLFGYRIESVFERRAVCTLPSHALIRGLCLYDNERLGQVRFWWNIFEKWIERYMVVE